MYSFKYSPRPRTLAGQRMVDDVPEPEKTRRIVALQAVAEGDAVGPLPAAVGSTQQVLVDGVSKRRETELAGRTSGNTIVNFPGDPAWLGRLVDVRITGAGPNSLKGEFASAVVDAGMAAASVAGHPVGECHADRNDDQGAHGRSGDQHSDRRAARCRWGEGASDLGRRVRSERDRRADRERRRRRVR